MKAQIARFVISLIAMVVALIAFMGIGWGWTSLIAAGSILITGFTISEAVFRRLADHETYRSDLEDRVRNPPL
jgi:fatty acid desaturase